MIEALEDSPAQTGLQIVFPKICDFFLSKLNEEQRIKLKELLSDKRYFELLYVTNKFGSMNSSYLGTLELFDNLKSLHDTELAPFVRSLSNLKLRGEQYSAILNSDAVAWALGKFINSEDFKKVLEQAFCIRTVPEFLPSFVRNQLTPIQQDEDIHDINIPERFSSIDEIIRVGSKIQLHYKNKFIHSEFITALLYTLPQNEQVKEAMNILDPIFGYDAKENIFNEAFDYCTLKTLLNNITQWKGNQEQRNLSYPHESYETIELPKSSSDTDAFKFSVDGNNETLKLLLGPNVSAIGQREFLEISPIHNIPILYSLQHLIGRVLTYIIQKLKMWGVDVLENSNLHKILPPMVLDKAAPGMPLTAGADLCLFKTKSGTNATTTTPESTLAAKASMSKLDILSCLLATCHPLVLQDLIRIMTFYPIALPLILPDLTQLSEVRKWKSLIPLLQQGVIKWEWQPGSIVHNQILTSPFKLILAVRIGCSQKGVKGKSTILNRLLQKDLFSSASIAGAKRGIPHYLQGSAEMVCLTRETCTNNNNFWDCEAGSYKYSLKNHYAEEHAELIILANLHGDALENNEVLEFLRPLLFACLIFIMPSSLQAVVDSLTVLKAKLGNVASKLVLVDPTEDCDDIKEVTICTNELVNDDSLDELRGLLCDIVAAKQEFLAPVSTIENERVVSISSLTSSTAETFLRFIKSNYCRNLKQLLKCQKMDPNEPIRYKDIGYYLQNKATLEIIIGFIEILGLPLEKRKVAFAQLDKEISFQTQETITPNKSKLIKYQNDLSKILRNAKSEFMQHEQSTLEEKIRLLYDEIENQSLGLEHFYREIGKLFQIAQLNPDLPNNQLVAELPSSYGELVIDGCAVEILDGDSGNIHGTWFNDICHSICKKYPGLRVFVISIIGLQSSGKSTLLNALFACKFAVSVGRCTRGLFMRLLFLEDSLAEEVGIDAILLIDTEGLGAPEKINDKESKKKDRQLAAFAMSVSDLTLINALGETHNDLTEILQIVIVTIARLDKIDMTPDILMVQHLNERDSTKTKGGSLAFREALKKAIQLTEDQDMDCGVQNSKSLEKMLLRVQNDELLKQFRAFKGGATANAPPSEQHHEDVVNLYKSILTVLKEARRSNQAAKKFCTWHETMFSYWDAISQQNWILEFKNIQDIQEFVTRANKIANVKQGVSNAFAKHSLNHERTFRKTIKTLEENQKLDEWDHEKKSIMEQVLVDLHSIPRRCSKLCEDCEMVFKSLRELFEDVEGKPCEQDTKLTINSFIVNQRQALYFRLDQQANATKIKFGRFAELDKIIEKFLQDSPGGYTEEKVDQVLTQVKHKVSTMLKVTSVDSKILHEILTVYQNDYAVIKAVQLYNVGQNRNINSHYITKNLRDINAISLGKIERAKNYVGAANYSKKLDLAQEAALFAYLYEIPNRLLKLGETDIYLDGMIATVKRLIVESICRFQETNFPTKIIESEFKWQVHIHGLKIFHEDMKQREAKWKESNDPLHILNANLQSYRERIKIILQNGFGSESEGGLICNSLLDAIQSKSQKAGDRTHISALQGTSWLTSGEGVRLKYFSELAKEVQEGKKERALAHFKDPKLAITSWFEKQIDSFPNTKGVQKFTETAKNECEKVNQDVANIGSFEDLKSYVDNYLAGEDIIQYKPIMSLDKIDFPTCKRSLLKDLEEKKCELQKHININVASKCPAMINLLGCVEYCPLCGSICWVNAGHNEDAGQVAKHHTCHQPMGLSNCYYIESRKLMSKSCDQNSDTDTWRKNGEDEIIKWPVFIARSCYSGWLYGSHHKRQFNDLMAWFFIKLHEDIAEETGYKPADISGLKKLNLDNILQTAQSVIQQ